jgi:adenylosuccinate lyase
MQEILESSGGLVFSQRVLLALVARGLTREEAYAIVQRNAMECWNTKVPLRALLARDPEVATRLDDGALAELFDPRWYLRHVDEVMERVASL